MKIRHINIITLAILILAMVSCRETIEIEEVIVNQGEGLTDWSLETHTDESGIDYSVVFPQDQVNRIDIVLSSSEYSSMRSNLASLASQNRGNDFTTETPEYVACDFYFNGTQWYEVGVRYKGNSSLYSAYNSGNGKLPLRLKFDKFEDEYPEIKDQRFYGFKDLSLGSNYNDNSFMREKSATDLFTAFGVPAVQTAFYEVYVDQGTGTPVYYGLYTLDEVVFDTMLTSVFGSNTGNCYKPDGDGAQFASSGFSLSNFEKKTNEAAADWSDIQELYNVLHSSLRTTDEATWKSNLESVFDVQGFLKYLAVNNTIQNWDTYGNMSHNYYLYHDPADDLIKWIVWDNNEAFSSGQGNRGAVSLAMSEVSSSWPLISYLINVDSYKEDYKAYLKDFNDNYYIPASMSATYTTYQNLIYSSATSENSNYTSLSGGTSGFTSEVEELKDFCSTRNSAVSSYVAD
ncbi:CotH kinase family protein [Wenyingzhuangia aestuarii]|uniref:CotH kinase family protein n=1 Tax=Wenyingzhuangia aestuarii TaxID=1647582 RepID=UPI00143C7DAB|nr:CotH kinase family protein [Wenyingzhuangia aestuarii]NJB83057.1 spore coat protein CotH [Wenyingzhuangia aestuarii]